MIRTSKGLVVGLSVIIILQLFIVYSLLTIEQPTLQEQQPTLQEQLTLQQLPQAPNITSTTILLNDLQSLNCNIVNLTLSMHDAYQSSNILRLVVNYSDFRSFARMMHVVFWFDAKINATAVFVLYQNAVISSTFDFNPQYISDEMPFQR